MNEIFAVHYSGELLDGTYAHSDYGRTRKGRIYTTIGPAKSFVSRKKKWLASQNREKEIVKYSIVRYVPGAEVKE